MMPMQDKVFFDTNILLYCYSSDEVEKQTRTLDLVENTKSSLISNQ